MRLGRSREAAHDLASVAARVGRIWLAALGLLAASFSVAIAPTASASLFGGPPYTNAQVVKMKEGVRRGDETAATQLAIYYDSNFGVEPFDQQVYWLTRASETGSYFANVMLIYTYILNGHCDRGAALFNNFKLLTQIDKTEIQSEIRRCFEAAGVK